ncbi:MAG: class I SAM-dependent methyltransferase [Theionarchaea archaeon]|nr:class I SAM-dependent methyltransferase [Theionarchaea archaeon]
MGYRKSAKYYDLFGEKSDIEYYRTLGKKYGAALEIGVGTARVALELALAGVDVWGIDNSDEMLQIARAKLRKHPEPIQERVTLRKGDMRDFCLSKTFPLVLIPSSGFSHCLTTEDQLACLTCVYDHLEEKGVLALDIHLPSPSYTNTLKLIDKKEIGARTVVRWISTRPDYVNQSLETVLLFETYENQEMTERIIESSRISLIYKRELFLLLEKAGFIIENVYGDFCRSGKVTNLVVVEALKP